jgi:ribosomal protein S18 acetylase RimI-like enzyme
MEPALIKLASVSCAEAFMDDQYTAYIIPDKTKRINLRYGFEYYLRYSVKGAAEVYMTSSNCEGIAVWLYSKKKEPFGQILRGGNPFLPLRCGLRYVYREMAANAFCQNIRKKYAPPRHMYLALLAVNPVSQGKGYSSALVKPMLQRLDEEKVPCYLETQNMKNVSLYRHFGFEVVNQALFPNTPYPIYAMLRQPKT